MKNKNDNTNESFFSAIEQYRTEQYRVGAPILDLRKENKEKQPNAQRSKWNTCAWVLFLTVFFLFY